MSDISRLLKEIGMHPDRRTTLIKALNTCGATGDGDDLDLVEMLPRLSAVGECLLGVPGLDEATRSRILQKCKADGIALDDLGGSIHAVARGEPVKLKTPMAAAGESVKNARLVAECRARCRRLGYDMRDDERVDLFKLDQAFASGDLNERFALKTTMAGLGLIPR